MNLQFGVSYDFHSDISNDSIPDYYYALSPNSPNSYLKNSIFNHIIDTYLYGSWDINEKIIFFSGIRSNIPIDNQRYYFSFQSGLKYHLNKKQSFLLSGGKYHNYSRPNFYLKNIPYNQVTK